MDKQRIARRVAGALGRKVTPDDITYVGAGDDPTVILTSGEVVGLRKGNVAYVPGEDRAYFKNGRRVRADDVV